MKEGISTVEYASMLYDFYGGLLNESQAEVMNLYHEDNLSLSEIATELGMTRQAVHYTLKKTETALEKYEEKLGLVAKYYENSRKAESAIRAAKLLLAGNELGEDSRKSVEKIVEIITEITE